MTVRYPAGAVTPLGADMIMSGSHPLVRFELDDGFMRFDLMGGLSVADPAAPEAILIRSLKGLIPPWETIDQKGATQDGVTYVDTLYGPIEVDAGLTAIGRDAPHLRKVVRDWIDANETKKTGVLSWVTPEMGKWWADVRWFRTPPDIFRGAQYLEQDFSWVWRADNGFWRSYDDVDVFEFAYESMVENFDTNDADDLGTNWTQYYTGPGGGFCHKSNGEMVWTDDPDDHFLTEEREVVNVRKTFVTATNNQVIVAEVGSFSDMAYGDQAENHIWGRVGRNVDGTWNGYGVRLMFRRGRIELAYYNNFVKTVLRSRFLLVPPLPGEKWALVCGEPGNERAFKVYRNRLKIMDVTESGTGSPLGSTRRAVGSGMKAEAGLFDQATPARIRRLTAGDNAEITQTGFLRRVDAGDQPMHDKYTIFGPGVFSFGNGPGSSDMIEFGPVLPNQVFWIDTDPQHPRIENLTSKAPTPQQLNLFQQALADFISFATGNNVPPLLQEIESRFGILPPQGNPWTLLNGRWSKESAIPPKLAGRPPEPHFVKVSIAGGNADSRVLVAGTPLRRYPA